MSVNAGIWVRVSTAHQHEDNQIPDLECMCVQRGWEIVRRYEISDASAFKGVHQQALDRMITDAHHGDFTVLAIWAVDRLCRGGIEELLRMIRKLRERGVRLVSFQEPWLDGTDASAELLSAVAAWVAHSESVKRSKRINVLMGTLDEDGDAIVGDDRGGERPNDRGSGVSVRCRSVGCGRCRAAARRSARPPAPRRLRAAEAVAGQGVSPRRAR